MPDDILQPQAPLIHIATVKYNTEQSRRLNGDKHCSVRLSSQYAPKQH